MVRFRPRGDIKQADLQVSAATGVRFSPSLIQKILAAQDRERKQLLGKMVQLRGLMPLLMKSRNGERWTAAERASLRDQVRALAHLSPYLFVMVLPGSFVALPVLAWWLDRRRQQRDA
ncbi:MAG: hypothetical protein Q8L44_15070 [Sulfuritalea sp.]|nr:hypothetical protein [Sulfuritalea sp.]